MNASNESYSIDTVLKFVKHCELDRAGIYSSTPNGSPTLYGTCYAQLIQSYLNKNSCIQASSIEFILQCQDVRSGLFVGPELQDWKPRANEKHDQTHLLIHLTCTVLPVLAQYGQKPQFPLHFAHQFCDLRYLEAWLNQRDFQDAWLEGNNLLFVGQLLVFLRDIENKTEAQAALNLYFEWLDNSIDPATGLWGTNGHCSTFTAMCGGYHQLLVYYHEQHPIQYPENLVDTVLALQHRDGGFSPHGGGGACEDVDAVDILVNLYKLNDYRRVAIRHALRRCLKHISSIQNADGGFPYRQKSAFTHMGIPATASPLGASNMFSTWFRLHTIALISEILTDDPNLKKYNFQFNSTLSMGWHRPWQKQHQIHKTDLLLELVPYYKYNLYQAAQRGRSLVGKMKHHLKRSAQYIQD